jgi:hypothetical protein
MFGVHDVTGKKKRHSNLFEPLTPPSTNVSFAFSLHSAAAIAMTGSVADDRAFVEAFNLSSQVPVHVDALIR